MNTRLRFVTAFAILTTLSLPVFGTQIQQRYDGFIQESSQRHDAYKKLEETLIKADPELTVPYWIKLLGSGSRYIRDRAALYLGSKADGTSHLADAWHALINNLTMERHAGVRRTVITSLRWLAPEGNQALITRAQENLINRSISTRIAANMEKSVIIETLREFGGKHSTPKTLKRVVSFLVEQSKNASLTHSSIYTLGKIARESGNDEIAANVTPHLIEALKAGKFPFMVAIHLGHLSKHLPSQDIVAVESVLKEILALPEPNAIGQEAQASLEALRKHSPSQ